VNDEQSAGDEESGTDGGRSLLDRVDEFPLFSGLISGVASFLGGYAVLLGVLTATDNADFSSGIEPVLKSAGYVFYNTIRVPSYQRRDLKTVYENESTGEVVAEQVRTTEIWQNEITGMRRIEQEVTLNGDVVNATSQTAGFDPNLSLPALLYLAMPIVALLAIGYVYGDRRFELAEWDPNTVTVQGLAGGAAMTIGYLLVALAGTYLLVRTGSEGQSMLRPARFEAVLYGIAYPMIIGTIGVVLGQLSTETLRELREGSDNGPEKSDEQ
jgi:hypothetical protein